MKSLVYKIISSILKYYTKLLKLYLYCIRRTKADVIYVLLVYCFHVKGWRKEDLNFH